jgi:hypothetical protein
MNPTKLERLIADLSRMAQNISSESLGDIQMLMREAANALATLQNEVERTNPGSLNENLYSFYYPSN